ncbi:MAG: prolyl oligopeptidase family serine peptidase [Kiritimatiellae bacterium]|jgi:dienelactone hydrolase|nr:prolyl oligopeptidase family serine peptidase [Kiritimatiellia bacterium]
MRYSVKTTVILSLIHLVCNTCCVAASDAGKNSTTIFTREKYTATVAADGSMTSLKIDGKEFLHERGSNPRGVYLFQGKAFGLENISQPDKDRLVASNEQAVVTYTFKADSIDWNVRNLTKKKLTLLIAFAPDVEAVRHATGLYEKIPFGTSVSTTTWFKAGLKLNIDNGGRIWGPWGDQKLQIWQFDIKGKEEHTSIFTPGIADKDELAEVKVALNYVAEPPTDPIGPMWDLSKLSKAPAMHPAEVFKADGVDAIFYESLSYRGHPTETFAYIGMPDVPEGTKVPGIVLIHGGGGTAFADWVRLWNSRGYAAISMDTCGCLPGGGHGKRIHHTKGGPGGWGGYNQIDWPRTDQWAYHAITDVILANSLLRSLPDVDKERIGVTGISWGGYLCSMVSGVDSRFKFAAPVYGCGFTTEHAFARSVLGLGEEKADRWMRWWDPSAYLANAKMPMLWVSGSNDFAYTLNALQKSYQLPKTPHTLCIRLRMPHGQGQGSKPEEIAAFADSVVKQGAPLVKFKSQREKDGKVWATFENSVPVVKAELNYTCDTGKWQDRKWVALPATIQGNKVTATLPEGTKVYYINLVDERKLVVSSEHVEVTQ